MGCDMTQSTANQNSFSAVHTTAEERKTKNTYFVFSWLLWCFSRWYALYGFSWGNSGICHMIFDSKWSLDSNHIKRKVNWDFCLSILFSGISLEALSFHISPLVFQKTNKQKILNNMLWFAKIPKSAIKNERSQYELKHFSFSQIHFIPLYSYGRTAHFWRNIWVKVERYDGITFPVLRKNKKNTVFPGIQVPQNTSPISNGRLAQVD